MPTCFSWLKVKYISFLSQHQDLPHFSEQNQNGNRMQITNHLVLLLLNTRELSLSGEQYFNVMYCISNRAALTFRIKNGVTVRHSHGLVITLEFLSRAHRCRPHVTGEELAQMERKPWTAQEILVPLDRSCLAYSENQVMPPPPHNDRQTGDALADSPFTFVWTVLFRNVGCRVATRGVQCSFKIRALIFPVGPEFKNLLIGYKLSLIPGTTVKLFQLVIEDFFLINSDGESII